MQLQEVSSCPICFGDLVPLSISETHNLKALETNVTFEFSICQTCRFVCQSRILPLDALMRYYRDSPKKLRDARPSDTALALYATQARFMEQAGTLAGARVLEIGADMGQLLDHLRDTYGCETYYEEENRTAREFLTEAGRHRDAKSAEPGTAYDWIALSHVLEHIIDPIPMLAGMRGRLAAGGKIFIEVPHHGVWDDIDTGFFFEHVSYFSAASLTAALDRAGYHVLRLEVTTDPQYNAGRCRIIRVCAQTRARDLIEDAAQVVRSHHRKQKQLRFAALDRLTRTEPAPGTAGVAIYGAGDLAGLVVEYLAQSGGRLAALFDTDPRKHGKLLGNLLVQGPGAIVGVNPETIVILSYAELDVRRTIADAGYRGNVIGWSEL